MVAQVETITIGGTAEAGDVYTITINGTSVTYTVQSGNATADILTGLVNAVNNATAAGVSGNATVASTVTGAVASGTTLTITGDADGVAFTSAVSVADAGNTQVSRVTWYYTSDGTDSGTYTKPSAGDVVRITIDGNNVDYTVQASDIVTTGGNQARDTNHNIGAGIRDAINADGTVSAIVTASNFSSSSTTSLGDPNQTAITVTADAAATSFTVAGAFTGATPTNFSTVGSQTAASTNDQTISTATTTVAVAVVTTTETDDNLPQINVVAPEEGSTSTDTSFDFTNDTGETATGFLVSGTGSGNQVLAILPDGVTLSNSGTTAGVDVTTGSSSLTTQVDTTGDPDSGESFLLARATDWVGAQSSDSTLDVRTITPTVASGVAPTEPIILSGSSNSSGSEAFVVDTRSLPSGSSVQLDNIEFAAIVGAATIVGGEGQNFVVGDDSAQTMVLGNLDDTLYGGGGDDGVSSTFGEDILYGNQGNDTVQGGFGMDTLYGGQGNDTVFGGNDEDTLFGNAGVDTLNGGQGDDVAYGNQGSDVLSGNTQNDTLFGGQGDDVLYGNQSTDLLVGGIGSDSLYGGQDSDTLSGAAGNDVVYGGAGSDTFVLSSGDGVDEVLDFSASDGDRLQVDVSGTSISSLSDLVQNLSTDGSGNLLVGLGTGDGLTLVGLTSSDAASVAVDLLSDGTTIASGTLDGTSTASSSALQDLEARSNTSSDWLLETG